MQGRLSPPYQGAEPGSASGRQVHGPPVSHGRHVLLPEIVRFALRQLHPDPNSESKATRDVNKPSMINTENICCTNIH